MVGIFEEAVRQNSLKTINEVALELELEQHVLRFWESKFSQIKPIKSKGNRRLYSQEDVETLTLIKKLLYVKGYTISGAINFINNDGNNVSNDNFDEMSLQQIKDHLLEIKQSLTLLVS
ncbi:MAG: MerR family transcriptional regulator [Rickettsiales bacterium]|jgi:DNA-binding transcriptional MerR regulator|nr:MerR family transcriptional regulator [Rickettsiales bacterium]